jgi:hypothetical protein
LLFQIQDAFATEPLIPAVDEIVIPSETEAVEDKIEDNLIEQSEEIKFSEPQTHLVTEEAQSEPIVQLEQADNYPKISTTEFLNSEESGFEGFIAENTFNMSEAAPIQSEIQTLEPALVEQVEEIAVKEIHADTEVIENGAIENGIETQLMESAAPIEGKQKYVVG